MLTLDFEPEPISFSGVASCVRCGGEGCRCRAGHTRHSPRLRHSDASIPADLDLELESDIFDWFSRGAAGATAVKAGTWGYPLDLAELDRYYDEAERSRSRKAGIAASNAGAQSDYDSLLGLVYRRSFNGHFPLYRTRQSWHGAVDIPIPVAAVGKLQVRSIGDGEVLGAGMDRAYSGMNNGGVIVAIKYELGGGKSFLARYVHLHNSLCTQFSAEDQKQIPSWAVFSKWTQAEQKTWMDWLASRKRTEPLQRGARVRRGQTLGPLGFLLSGHHLHFEIISKHEFAGFGPIGERAVVEQQSPASANRYLAVRGDTGKAYWGHGHDPAGWIWYHPLHFLQMLNGGPISAATNQPGAGSPAGAAPSAGAPPVVGALSSTPAVTPAQDRVRFAQRVLNAVEGERLDTDGKLGSLTRAAVKRFRDRYGLGAAGELDGAVELALAQRALEDLARQSFTTRWGTRDAELERRLSRFKSEQGLGSDAVLDANTRAALARALEARPAAPTAGGGTARLSHCENEVINLVLSSPLRHSDWNRHGVAPIGYLKGMALTFARLYCKLKAGDPVAARIAKASSNDPSLDALAVYAQDFARLGMQSSVDGADTLRHVFVLLTGLGIRESSGRYCEGRDLSAKNIHPNVAEAGLFQMSHSIGVGSSEATYAPLRALYERLKVIPYSGYREVFLEGVTCKPGSLAGFGTTAGGRFREFCVMQPALSAEIAALGLRMRRKHWGPIGNHTVTLEASCDALFSEVQAAVDRGLCCANFLSS